MISGWGRAAGAVIPALGSGRYSPGPNIGLPSWLQGADPHCTLNVFWGQPGALATVSTKANTRACKSSTEVKLARFRSFRTTILNHNSIWFIHDACFGV